MGKPSLVYRVLALAPELRFSWARRQLDRAYQADIRNAKSPEERKEADDLRRHELGTLAEERHDWYSRKLRRTANRLHVPLPPTKTEDGKTTPYWECSDFTSELDLTTEGCAKLRELIRQEQRAQFELFSRWGTFVAAVIAALTGLVTVIHTLLPNIFTRK